MAGPEHHSFLEKKNFDLTSFEVKDGHCAKHHQKEDLDGIQMVRICNCNTADYRTRAVETCPPSKVEKFWVALTT